MWQHGGTLRTLEAGGCSLPAFRRPAPGPPCGTRARGGHGSGEWGGYSPFDSCHPPGAWSSPRCWHHVSDDGVTCASLLCPLASYRSPGTWAWALAARTSLRDGLSDAAGQFSSSIKRETMSFCSWNRICSWVRFSLQRLHLVCLQTLGSWHRRFVYSLT